MILAANSTDALLAELPRRIGALPRRWSQEDPGRAALVDRGVTMSYGQLVTAFESAAQLLQALGVRAGDRVMIVGENCLAQVVLLFAVSELDASVVVVNARLSAREIDAIRDNCGARRVLYMTGVSQAMRARMASAMAQHRSTSASRGP